MIFIKVKSKLTLNTNSIWLNSMLLLIRTNQYMHFYLVTLNIVPPIVCVENYRNKSSVISYLWLFFLSPFSTDTQSYTKSFKLKLTKTNVSNVIYKAKSYYPQPVQGAAHTTYHFVLLLWKWDNCCILQRLNVNQIFFLVRSTSYFWNDFLKFMRRHLTGLIKRGKGGRVRGWEMTVRQGEFSLHRYYKHKTFDKKCYWFPRPVLQCILLLLHYAIIWILTIVACSVNKSIS